MPQKTDVELLSQKEIIKTETSIGANTATRVGQMLEDIIDSKLNNDTPPTINAEDIPVTPAGSLSATDVQAALEELDADITAGLDGLKWKSPSVRLKTTGNVTLSGEQTIDDFVTSTDDVLVASQNTPSQNGIYTTGAGAWTRRSDADTGTELEGAVVGVLEGTTNDNTTWRQVTNNITLGVSSIVWEVFGTSVPDANASDKGIAKLYPSTSLGSNTDGAPDQNAVKTYVDTQVAGTGNIGALLYLYNNFI